MRQAAYILLYFATMLHSFAEDAVTSLPVFASGPHKDKHFVYEHENFTMCMIANGTCLVQPMDQGKPVGKMFIALSVRPYTWPEKAFVERSIASFKIYSQPTVIPKSGGKVSISGMLEDQVEFEAEYEFSGPTVTVSGGCKDPRKIETPTNFRFLTRFSDAAELGESPADDLVTAKCRDKFLILRFSDSGKDREFTFDSKEINSVSRSAMDYAIVRGAHGPRVIEFRPKGKEGMLYHYVYPGHSLWESFVIDYTTPAKRTRPSATSTSMIIR